MKVDGDDGCGSDGRRCPGDEVWRGPAGRCAGELLTNLGVTFEVVVSGEDEDSPETNPEKLAGDLGLLKARSVANLHPAIIEAHESCVQVIAVTANCCAARGSSPRRGSPGRAADRAPRT